MSFFSNYTIDHPYYFEEPVDVDEEQHQQYLSLHLEEMEDYDLNMLYEEQMEIESEINDGYYEVVL